MKSKFPHSKVSLIIAILLVALSASAFAMDIPELARDSRSAQEESLRQAELNREARAAATDRASSPSQRETGLLSGAPAPTTVDEAATNSDVEVLSKEDFCDVLERDLVRWESEQNGPNPVPLSARATIAYLLYTYSSSKAEIGELDRDQATYSLIQTAVNKLLNNGQSETVKDVEFYANLFEKSKGAKAREFFNKYKTDVARLAAGVSSSVSHLGSAAGSVTSLAPTDRTNDVANRGTLIRIKKEDHFLSAQPDLDPVRVTIINSDGTTVDPKSARGEIYATFLNTQLGQELARESLGSRSQATTWGRSKLAATGLTVIACIGFGLYEWYIHHQNAYNKT